MMLKHSAITIQRIGQFIQRFQGCLRVERVPLRARIAGPVDRITPAQARLLEYRAVEAEVTLGPAWSTHWIRLEGTIPEAWRNRAVDLLFHGRMEALLWIDGKPYQGLNHEGPRSSKEGGRIDARLPSDLTRGGMVSLDVEAACNYLGGTDRDNHYLFAGAELALVDQEASDIYHDLRVPWGLLTNLLALNKAGAPWQGYHVEGHLTPWLGFLLEKMNDICNAGHPDDASTWPKLRPLLKEIYQHRNASYAHELSALGHCHIDTAWLWPLAEARRKCARSFSSALAYMARYPEYKFSCSQAQQYQWMKDGYPSIYEGIKAAVKRGQWIPVGGTWVEPDCNMISGESMVRQFLYGKRFFRTEFGWDCREFWSPDAFGYSGALPQIMQGAGVHYFLTQKLSWNQFNKPQYQNFHWRGIDGSEVLTHFPPADTYNAMSYEALTADLLLHEAGAADHDRCNEGLLLFGYGDGGGGPTTDMLEVLQRVGDFQGYPRTVQRGSQEFFQRLQARLRSVPVVEGELYFELHRGTYTTQAANKAGNRRGETLLREVELLSAVALRSGGAPYPGAEVERLWRQVLLNQFHDILPGSSITEVHEESRRDYEEIMRKGNELLAQSLATLGGPKGDGGSIVNTCGWERRGLIETETAPDSTGQKSWRGMGLALIRVPSCGCASWQDASVQGGSVWTMENADGFVLENARLRVEFSRGGQIVRLLDIASPREVIDPERPANRFVLYEDRPVASEAWDLDVFYLEKPVEFPVAREARVLEWGPLRAGIEFIFGFGPSTMTQHIFLAADAAQIEFECEVDWHHRHRLMKVEFPVRVHAPEATYEIQFGHVRRPTHASTTQDMARFEGCGHRWIDLGEPGYGVSIFTDSKYGYAVRGQVMSVSLLRGTTYPDARADLGHHQFRFALYPHAGSFRDAQTVRRAYEFNHPWRLLPGTVATQSWFSVDSPDLVIDTVKKAEDDDALIVRLYDCHGNHGVGHLRSPLPFGFPVLVNLLEETVANVAVRDGRIVLPYRPFEIISVRLPLALSAEIP